MVGLGGGFGGQEQYGCGSKREWDMIRSTTNKTAMRDDHDVQKEGEDNEDRDEEEV
jgi:hypothetical protein